MKTTFSRIFFSAAVVLLSALLLVGVSFQTMVRGYLKDSAMEDLRKDSTVIAQLAAAYYTEGNLTSQDFLLNLTVAAGVTDADAVICDAEGVLVLCSGSPMGCSHQGMRIDQGYLSQVLSTGCVESSGVIGNLYEDSRYIVGRPITDASGSQTIGIVIVSEPISDTTLVLKRLSDFYILISMVVILIAFILMTVMVRRQSKPLRGIARVASEFGHGNLQVRAAVDDQDPLEVQELALAFNNMAASLEKGEYQRREFVANVSHELKTPMTTIGGYVDGMLDGTIPPEDHRQCMQIVSSETKRLSRLVRSMLDISQLQEQEGIPDEQRSRFDISECAGRALITFEQKILEKGLQVQVDMPELPLFTFASQDAITQVIYNLMDNAVKFCPQGGNLGLRIQEGPHKIYVTVENDGQTIPPEELPLLFDRFHKLDKARSKDQDGWGLGLYIVRTLICSHGEDISVTSANGKTEFTFTLPRVN